MFTGIIENCGKVTAVERRNGGLQLKIELGPLVREARPGDSIAVNGACLTVESLQEREGEFYVSSESLAKTWFKELKAGQRVNLERALRVGEALGGHLVQGHVEAVGKVVEIVVGNLVRNAINYTRQGSVEVTVTRYSVRVVDTGIGMSGEELDQAFEPFYRADESRGVTKGHGLGLAIVKRLVHQFGWTISAHSTPDEGTGIEVRFQRPGAGAGGVAGQPA